MVVAQTLKRTERQAVNFQNVYSFSLKTVLFVACPTLSTFPCSTAALAPLPSTHDLSTNSLYDWKS